MRRFPLIGLLAPLSAPAAGDATRASADGFESAAYLLQVSVGLLVVLAGIFLLAWLLRRMGGFRHSAGGHLRVLEGLAIGPRERIVLLQCGNEQIVVGIAPGRVQTLHVLREPVPEPAAAEVPAPAFARRLQEALKGRGQA